MNSWIGPRIDFFRDNVLELPRAYQGPCVISWPVLNFLFLRVQNKNKIGDTTSERVLKRMTCDIKKHKVGKKTKLTGTLHFNAEMTRFDWTRYVLLQLLPRSSRNLL